MATNRSGGGPGSIFLFAPKTPPLLNSLSWCSSLLLLLSPVCVPCTCSPVVDVLVTNVLDNNGGGEDTSAPPWFECKIWGLEDDNEDGGGDERRDTSANEATVASSLNVKLSFTKSDKFLATNEKYMKLQNKKVVSIDKWIIVYYLFLNSNYYAFTLF